MGKSQSKISKEDMDFLQQKTDLDKSTIEVSLKNSILNTDINLTVEATNLEKSKIEGKPWDHDSITNTNTNTNTGMVRGFPEGLPKRGAEQREVHRHVFKDLPQVFSIDQLVL